MYSDLRILGAGTERTGPEHVHSTVRRVSAGVSRGAPGKHAAGAHAELSDRINTVVTPQGAVGSKAGSARAPLCRGVTGGEQVVEICGEDRRVVGVKNVLGQVVKISINYEGHSRSRRLVICVCLSSFLILLPFPPSPVAAVLCTIALCCVKFAFGQQGVFTYAVGLLQSSTLIHQFYTAFFVWRPQPGDNIRLN